MASFSKRWHIEVINFLYYNLGCIKHAATLFSITDLNFILSTHQALNRNAMGEEEILNKCSIVLFLTLPFLAKGHWGPV